MDDNLSVKKGFTQEECKRFIDSRVALLNFVKSKCVDVPLAQKQIIYEKLALQLAVKTRDAKRERQSKVEEAFDPNPPSTANHRRGARREGSGGGGGGGDGRRRRGGRERKDLHRHVNRGNVDKSTSRRQQ